jgi:predicted phosphodiesterase
MRVLLFFYIFLFLVSCKQVSKPENDSDDSFSFVLLADTRNYTGDNIDYFRGACESIKKTGGTPFIISPGDIDPPDSTFYTIQKYIGKDVIWYPVVGNHEAETPSDMEWMRTHNKDGNSLPNIVNLGPESCKETNYSFDYKNTHFVILNIYSNDTCDVCTKGEVNDLLYNWLKDDLQKTKKENTFVIGHEPAYPMPDMETTRLRHAGNCLNQFPETRDRFVKLLQQFNVIAYVVGHTHNYSIVKIHDLWHIDVGHARGIEDMGARSTFVKMAVNGDNISFETYRLKYENHKYEIFDKGNLD